ACGYAWRPVRGADRWCVVGPDRRRLSQRRHPPDAWSSLGASKLASHSRIRPREAPDAITPPPPHLGPVGHTVPNINLALTEWPGLSLARFCHTGDMFVSGRKSFRRSRKLALLRSSLASAAGAAALLVGLAPTLRAQTDGLQKINHIVVIYQEN